MDKFSYAIGLGIGQNLLSMGAQGINVNDFAQAISDVLNRKETAISHNEAREIVNKYFEELEAKMKHRKRKSFLSRKRQEGRYCYLAQRFAVPSIAGRQRQEAKCNRPCKMPL